MENTTNPLRSLSEGACTGLEAWGKSVEREEGRERERQTETETDRDRERGRWCVRFLKAA